MGLELVHATRHNHPDTSKQVGFEHADLLAAAFRLKSIKPDASTHFLELVEYRSPAEMRIVPRTHNPGSAHLAFAVDDIFEEYERMKELAVRFRSAPVLIETGPNTGGYTVYLLDCSDISLEMIQARGEGCPKRWNPMGSVRPARALDVPPRTSSHPGAVRLRAGLPVLCIVSSTSALNRDFRRFDTERVRAICEPPP